MNDDDDKKTATTEDTEGRQVADQSGVTKVTEEPFDKPQGKPEKPEIATVAEESGDDAEAATAENTEKASETEQPANTPGVNTGSQQSDHTGSEPQADETDKEKVEESAQTADHEAEETASEPEEKVEELDKQSFSLNKNPEVVKAEEKTPTEETREEVTEGPTDIKTSSKKDAKGAHWYVVHTYSGHEAKVAATLRQRIESQRLADKILEILVPTQEKIEIKEGKKNTIREKLFPGYLLIKMVLDDASWLAVRTTPGITSFVGNAQKPTPLPESEVATIQRFMTMEAPKFKAAFTVGEAVKITDGPFSDFLGSISEIDDEKGKVKVLVSIFGRETPVELDFLQIAKL